VDVGDHRTDVTSRVGLAVLGELDRLQVAVEEKGWVRTVGETAKKERD
jgi:hypothetical protein